MLKNLPALAALVVSAILILPTTARAQETVSARVSYADLNLASSSGQRAAGLAASHRLCCNLGLRPFRTVQY